MGGVEAWWKETTDEETGKWANGSSIVSFFLFLFFFLFGCKQQCITHFNLSWDLRGENESET